MVIVVVGVADRRGMNNVGGGIFELAKQQYRIINDEQWQAQIYCSTARAFGGEGMSGTGVEIQEGWLKDWLRGRHRLRVSPVENIISRSFIKTKIKCIQSTNITAAV